MAKRNVALPKELTAYILIGLLFFAYLIHTYKNWDYASGSCGYWVKVKYTYPDDQMMDDAVPIWVGPFFNAETAQMRADEFMRDTIAGSKCETEIKEDCQAPR